MKLAILTPVHGNGSAARVIAQTRNYCAYLRPSTDVRFYLHISRASSAEFRSEIVEHATDFTCPLVVSPKSRETSLKSALGALIQLNQDLREDDWEPDYVMWHSDSDLMIKQGVEKVISRYSYGVGSSPFDLETSSWAHAEKMRVDPRLPEFLKQCCGGDKRALKLGRVECSFMEWALWTKVSECINCYFGGDYFDNPGNHWCAEEILLPSLAGIFSKQSSSSRQQLCFTKLCLPGSDRDPGSQKITIDDVNRLRDQEYFYCAKWFSPSLDDDARMYLDIISS